jgi:PKD repeat protein
MHRLIAGLFLLVSLIAAPFAAAADTRAGNVTLQLGSKQAFVDGASHELNVAPRASDGVTVVPLRFIVEVFGAEAVWDAKTGEISIQHEEMEICLNPGENKALVNGKELSINGGVVVENGSTLVPLRFLAENLNYKVSFVPTSKEIHISQLPPPNRPPVADFKVQRDTVDQGETVVYEDTSYDPDGDAIVERKWEGNEKAFFKPGEYRVTLMVKDSRGAWSEPCTRVIRVTERVKMDKFTYTLHNPVLGENLDISWLKVLDLKLVDPAVSMNRDNIIISDSPETITEDGILYSDMLDGKNRLYYHHYNGSNETKRIYLLAINQGQKPVQLTVKKWGAAGPADPMTVGRVAAYRYLDFDYSKAKKFEVNPGEKVILNEGINNVFNPGQAVHGIFDIEAEDDLLFSIVAVGKQDPVDGYEALSVLPRDGKHIRGTFKMANRFVSVNIQGDEPVRVVLADGKEDLFLYGKDKTTGRYGLVTNDMGNYGVIYQVSITSRQKVAVLLNPRGGVLAGAGKWDGEAFYIPNRGILKPQVESALIGVAQPGKQHVFTFIPPAGSFLPVNLIFMPVPGTP